jgi:hypothetical protein
VIDLLRSPLSDLSVGSSGQYINGGSRVALTLMCISLCSYTTYMYAAELDRKSRSCSVENVLLGLGESDGRYHAPNWTFCNSGTNRPGLLFYLRAQPVPLRVDIQRLFKRLFTSRGTDMRRLKILRGGRRDRGHEGQQPRPCRHHGRPLRN